MRGPSGQLSLGSVYQREICGPISSDTEPLCTSLFYSIRLAFHWALEVKGIPLYRSRRWEQRCSEPARFGTLLWQRQGLN